MILTFGVILIVLATAGKLYAEPQSKAKAHYLTGIKLLQQKGDAASSHAKANIWFTMAATDGHSSALFHLGYRMKPDVASSKTSSLLHIFIV